MESSSVRWFRYIGREALMTRGDLGVRVSGGRSYDNATIVSFDPDHGDMVVARVGDPGWVEVDFDPLGSGQDDDGPDGADASSDVSDDTSDDIVSGWAPDAPSQVRQRARLVAQALAVADETSAARAVQLRVVEGWSSLDCARQASWRAHWAALEGDASSADMWRDRVIRRVEYAADDAFDALLHALDDERAAAIEDLLRALDDERAAALGESR